MIFCMHVLNQVFSFPHLCEVLDNVSTTIINLRGRYESVSKVMYLPEGLFVELYIALGIVGNGSGKALEFWSLCISLVMGLLVWRVYVGGW